MLFFLEIYGRNCVLDYCHYKLWKSLEYVEFPVLYFGSLFASEINLSERKLQFADL